MDTAILKFLFTLKVPTGIPQSVEVMNPYESDPVREVCRLFYSKYYTVPGTRFLLIGINPGRFGGGITGIPFTDPIQLESHCGIPNAFEKKPEISSRFIYDMINAFGGPISFFRHFLITAMSPLGFTRGGKNLNYYDDPKLQQATMPFIVETIKKQLDCPGVDRGTALCIGEGKNLKILEQLNGEYRFFERVLALPHPRFIMQYRYKKKDDYIRMYLEVLRSII
jgi:hypothetical protein